jgi:hypothetical protein
VLTGYVDWGEVAPATEAPAARLAQVAQAGRAVPPLSLGFASGIRTIEKSTTG